MPDVDVFGFSGYSMSGKTFLITEIIAKCILPQKHGGKNCGAILINTDHHFEIANLIQVLECYIKINNSEQLDIKTITKESLNNLIVVNVFDSHQFYLTFQKLDALLATNKKVSIIILDSILAYYWYDRLTGGIKKIDSYQKTILRSLQNLTKEHKLTILYTKTTTEVKKEVLQDCKNYPMLEKINYRILLTKNDDTFMANVTSPDNESFVKYFKINKIIEWL